MLRDLKITEKQSGFTWNNETFRITSKISEEFLYLASRETVYHNGKILCSQGGFRSRKGMDCNFQDQSGETHKFELRCFPVKSNWLNYTVLIDDIIIYKGSTPIKGFFATAAVYLPILFIIFLVLGRLLGFFLIYFNL